MSAIVMKKSAARVWNEGQNDYRETFRGEEYVIPGLKHGAGKNYLYFPDYISAVKFVGNYVEPKKTADGQWIQNKPLRLEKIDGSVDPTTQKFISHVDGKVFDTEAQLKAHLETVSPNLLVKDEKRDEAAKSFSNVTPIRDTTKDEIKELLLNLASRLEKLEDKQTVVKGRSSRKKVDDDTKQHI